MDKLNKSVYVRDIDGTKVVRILMNNKQYQTCLVCEDFFELTGNNQKYCTECAKRVNIKKTGEKNKERYYAAKVEPEQDMKNKQDRSHCP